MSTSPPVTVILGPDAIRRVDETLDALLSTLDRSRYVVRPDGNLEFAEAEPALAIRELRAAVSTVVPEHIQLRLGQRSGLGWNIFFGHVVGWWLPQRGRIGFLRALVDRADLHGAHVQLHWNEGRVVEPASQPIGQNVLWWGAVLGGLLGLLVTRHQRWNSALGFLALGFGLVAARTYQRVGRRLVCGDHLCRAPITRRSGVCGSCGAATREPR